MSAPHRRYYGTHFASYWKFFGNEDEPLEVDIWRIKGGSRLANAVTGDLLWLFTSGQKCVDKLDEHKWPANVTDAAAYLAEVFTVRRVVPDETGDFAFCVEGVPELCKSLTPPIAVDDIVRPPGHEDDEAIGSLRQGAWRLQNDMADQLCERLRRDAPGVYEDLFRQQ